MKRGQVAIEFLVLSGFMIFVFSTFFLVVQQRANVEAEKDILEEVTIITNIIDNELTLARRVHPGYERSFKIPVLISGEPYSITLVPAEAPSEVIITYVGGDEYVLFLDMNLSVDSTLGAGENVIVKPTAGNLSVKHISDVVTVCSNGQTNLGYIAGGTDLWNIVDGSWWDTGGTPSRSQILTVNTLPTQLTCCNTDSCPSDSQCFAPGVAIDNTLKWACINRGGGPTFFSCSAATDGKLVDGTGGTLCCSKFSQDPDGIGVGVNIGDYGFKSRYDPSKLESAACGDNSDNDCDTLPDSLDTADCP